jgi:2-haloacid dehalogenase
MSTDARTVFDASKTTTLTFDCYGTLIDWESGACRALRDIYGYSRSEVTDDALIDLFLHADARIIREKIFPYPKVLQRVAQSVAESLRVRSDPALEASFASSLPTWPMFEETNPSPIWLARRYRLAIISNVDDHQLSQTVKQLGMPFEVIVTSEQTKSYKPDRAIFDRAVKLIREHPGSIIHIAEGRYEATPAARTRHAPGGTSKQSKVHEHPAQAFPGEILTNAFQNGQPLLSDGRAPTPNEKPIVIARG